MYKTYLVHYIETTGVEEQVAVRCKGFKELKKFTKDMNVIGWRDVSAFDKRTQELNKLVRTGRMAITEYVERHVEAGRVSKSDWKGHGIGSLYDK